MDLLQQCKLREKGDAEVFEFLYKDKLIYDHNEGKWYIFNGHVWEDDKYASVMNLVELVAKSYESALEQSTINPVDDSRAYRFYKARINRLRERRGIGNTTALATAKMPLKEDWDSNPYMLAVENGIIDLRTGKFRNGQPSDYMRNFSNVEWKGIDEPAPRWEQFLKELFPRNPEIPEFLQRMFGYSASGLSVEHVFAMFYGPRGRNGKDVMLETLCNVLGGKMAGPISKEILLSGLKNPGAAGPHLFELQGKRLIYSDETNDGASFDTAQVKMLSGGAPFIAKKLYCQPVTIKPQYLIVITSNSKPAVDADDDALWERLICVEYTERFVDRPVYDNEHLPDKYLKDKLAAESSGILAWLVRGFLEWQEKGLMIPESVMYNTDEYREEQDSLGRFIKDECIKDENAKVNVTKLFDHYAKWASVDGVKKLSRRDFAKKVGDRYHKSRIAQGVFYFGLTIKDSPKQELENMLMDLTEPK